MSIRRDSSSHKLLIFLSTKTEAHASEIDEEIYKAFDRRGPMPRMLAKGFVEKISFGVYSITQLGKDELRKV